MLLELDRFTVTYGSRKALDNVTVALDSKALGLLGPNGAGKSTLIRALLGHIPPSAGSAQVENFDISRQSRRIREITGYMPEHESYLPGMTPVRFLRYIGEMCGLRSSDAMERAHEALFHVDLGEVRYRPLETLSYGLHQKVRLAQALIHGPRVLILDEPTNGLDPTARDEMLALINDTIENSETKVIMSSHLLPDIETCCHDVLVLNRGRAVASGNIEEMKQPDRNVYDLGVEGNLDIFMSALSELGCECALGLRGRLQVNTPEGFHTRVFFETALEKKVQIRHFYARKDTLEDIFLKVLLEEEEPSKTPV